MDIDAIEEGANARNQLLLNGGGGIDEEWADEDPDDDLVFWKMRSVMDDDA